ncbi:hypothetical protein [Streptomyces sp. NBC_00147]|uniref:hypothetical protein n=1 Tax=Streptomyces sp. NBC_00147 TaxID=2975667 RepID=UPI0032431DF3
MKLRTRRWLLAPIRQWHTHNLMRRHGPSLDYPTAWALITLRHSPDEFAFVRQAIHEAAPGTEPGLHHDNWSSLSPRERMRRTRWLTRHRKTPIEQLNVSEIQLQRAGLRVVDWGAPEDGP